jgi:hypothetical protein
MSNFRKSIIKSEWHADNTVTSDIQLFNGEVLQHRLDNCNYYLYDRFALSAFKGRYLCRRQYKNGIRHAILVANDVLGLPIEFKGQKNYIVNHKNNNGLDDRACNLNICTLHENQAHVGTHFGVYYHPRARGWYADIRYTEDNVQRRICSCVCNTYEEAQEQKQWIWSLIVAGVPIPDIQFENSTNRRLEVNPTLPQDTILTEANKYDYIIKALYPAKKAYMQSIGFEIDAIGNVIWKIK